MPELIDGIDFVSGDLFSFQQANRMKNNWYSGATPPDNPTNGMFWVKNDGAVYYYFNAWILLHGIHTETLLASVASVDLEVEDETTLFTVPAGMSCIITKVVMRLATGAGLPVGASISFGFNAGTSDDVIANAVFVLDAATEYIIIPAADKAKVGVATELFAINVNTGEGAAMTVTLDVFGYLF